MYKAVIIGMLVLGSSLAVSAQRLQRSQRIRLTWGDYECSCTYFCPRYGINLGTCYEDNNYWGWGRTQSRCCVPSYMEDMNGGYGDNGWGRGDNNGAYGGDFW